MEKVKLEDVRVAKVDYKQWSPELQAEYDARVRAVEKISDALQQLDRLILSGEEPIALLAQLGASLRRLAAATACIRDAERSGQRMSLSQALQQAGVQPYFVKKSEQQLRQLGRPRASRLFGWLLKADLAMKGASSSPPRKRLVLERLIVQLSSAAKEPNPRTAAVS